MNEFLVGFDFDWLFGWFTSMSLGNKVGLVIIIVLIVITVVYLWAANLMDISEKVKKKGNKLDTKMGVTTGSTDIKTNQTCDVASTSNTNISTNTTDTTNVNTTANVSDVKQALDSINTINK